MAKDGPERGRSERGKRLSRALKALRRRRDLRSAELAARLGMPIRSFEHFESGRGRLNVERVEAAAAALDSDPLAVLMAVEIGSPAFAVRCADNKLMTILALALQDFDAAAADDIALLDPQTLISAFRRTFAELAELATARRALATRRPDDPA